MAEARAINLSAPKSPAPLGSIDYDPKKDLPAEVRAGLQLFVVAVKNCGLYPSNNKIRQFSVEKAYEWFTAFLDENESLRLFVDMDSFLFQGVQVLQEKPGESAVVFPFFRDGVQWIEFLEGLSPQEFLVLMEHLNRFRSLKEEDEDDLVTSMWSSDFQFIKYKTANEFWEIDPVTEIASLKVGFANTEASARAMKMERTIVPLPKGKEGFHGGGNVIGALMNWLHKSGSEKAEDSGLFRQDGQLSPPKTGLSGANEDGSSDDEDESDTLEGHYQYQPWAINPREKLEMERLMAAEFVKGPTGVAVDLTLALLFEHNQSQGIYTVMQFLAEIVRFALAKANFQGILTLLKKFAVTIQSGGAALDGLKHEFIRVISDVSVLEGFNHIEPNVEIKADELLALKKFLKFMPANAGKVLVDVAKGVKEERVKSELLNAIADRAQQGGLELSLHANEVLSPKDLVTLFNNFNEKNITTVVPFLSGGAKHVSRQVREIAVRLLLDQNTSFISGMSHLLAEPEPSLARQIYFLLGQTRSSVVEKIIINFLHNTMELSIPRSPELLLLCYRTLGLVAATGAAVEFASSVLLKKDILSFFGVSSADTQIHRIGGALALYLMPPNLGAQDILKSASTSFFRSLRKACAEAKEEAEIYRSRQRKTKSGALSPAH
ncbi:MAG: hypothetical protein LBE38_01205 [Deltaproteobacteria bacterium]|jgi:hypothetical protein|nr:hypothetical protein [Deltaproteobacteria bacterium]